MQEDYLHFLWEFQKWKNLDLRTSEGSSLAIVSPGTHNFLSGPDFFNARVVIGDQQWAGNVEIHINSSDWYLHGHEKDPAYDSVVLHVVWNHDADIFRRDNSAIPVLELKNRVSGNALHQYENLLQNSSEKWINCENEFAGFDSFSMENWLERLYFERLEEKSKTILTLLDKCAGDWEEVLFRMLARNFGLNINGDAFFSIAGSIPFPVIRKCQNDQEKLESLFLGQAGMLKNDVEEPYFSKLQGQYLFLQKKFNLDRTGVLPVSYFRLRPDNFPELRLSQLAAVYNKDSSVFSTLIEAQKIEDFQELLSGEISPFWNTHYTFRKEHSKRQKKLSLNFIRLQVINTLMPVKFCYLQKQGKETDELLGEIMSSIPSENNQIVDKYNLLRPSTAVNALQSQALLRLKKEYCDKKRCLNCALGTELLQKEVQNG